MNPFGFVRRVGLVGLLVLLVLPVAASAQRQAIPLNDFTRLGQRFTVIRPFTALRVSVPSWLDNEGGLTLTLWDSPDRKRRLAEKAFENVPDNAMVDLVMPRRAPAGSYYWEVDRRTGTTRVGLYADPLAEESDDCAYIDGVPQRKLRFVFETVPSLYPTLEVAALLGRIHDGTPQEKADACRTLALVGNARVVPALARLLRDPNLSHMARLALEAIPGTASDSALRAALKEVVGPLRIGIINSLGNRRDTRAVADLSRLMTNEGDPTASAAAVALGRIGSPAAADALMKALYGGVAQRAQGVYEGVLLCADALAEAGRKDRAITLYDALASAGAPAPIHSAALRGGIAARGSQGLSHMMDCLRSDDDIRFRVGLWALQRHVSGHEATEAVLAALETMRQERRAAIVEAIGRRGDQAAVPGIIRLIDSSDMAIRLAAVGALAHLGGSEALAALSRLLTGPDAEMASAARSALGTLPREDVAGVALSLLDTSDAHSMNAALGLILVMRLHGFSERLVKALGHDDRWVRVTAVQALGALGNADAVSPLLDIVVAPREDGEQHLAATAITAIARRLDRLDDVAGMVSARMAGASPERRVTLVRILGDLGSPRGLAAVRDVLKDADERLQSEALNALCAWPTADAAPDLLRLASELTDSSLRLRCLRGLLRIAGSADMSPTERLRLCREAAPLVERHAEKRMLLGVLGQAGLVEGVTLALPYLDDAGTREEAGAAIVAIAEKSGKPLPAELRAALERVAAVSGDSDHAKRAREILRG